MKEGENYRACSAWVIASGAKRSFVFLRRENRCFRKIGIEKPLIYAERTRTRAMVNLGVLSLGSKLSLNITGIRFCRPWLRSPYSHPALRITQLRTKAELVLRILVSSAIQFVATN
jgi:hypothetical protein